MEAGNREDEGAFANVPDEVMLKIFSNLNKRDLIKTVTLVCTRWRKLAHDPFLWKELTLYGSKLTTEKALEVIGGKTQLKQLVLYYWMSPSADELLQGISNLSWLESLSLQYVAIKSNATLDLIVSECTALKAVDMYGCSIPKDVRSLVDVFAPCSKLERLSLKNNGMQAPVDVNVVRSYSNLQELCIYKHRLDADVQEVIRACATSLRKLTLWRLEERESFLSLAQCQKLEELCLIHVPIMTDADLLCLRDLHHLQSLSITYAQSLTTRGIQNFFLTPAAKQIKSLDLEDSNLDEACLLAIASNTSQLTHLRLKSCRQVTLSALKNVICRFPALKCLDLTWCEQLSEGLAELAKMRPDIQILYRDIWDVNVN